MSYAAVRRPIKTFRSGTIKAAIWRNEGDRDGQTVVNFSVSIQKRYYDADAKSWHDSDSFFPEDLPKLALVATKAYEYTTLKEEDPSASESEE